MHLIVPVAGRIDYPGVAPEHSYLSDQPTPMLSTTQSLMMRLWRRFRKCPLDSLAGWRAHAFAYLKVTHVLLLVPLSVLLNLEVSCAFALHMSHSMFTPFMFDMRWYSVVYVFWWQGPHMPLHACQ